MITYWTWIDIGEYLLEISDESNIKLPIWLYFTDRWLLRYTSNFIVDSNCCNQLFQFFLHSHFNWNYLRNCLLLISSSIIIFRSTLLMTSSIRMHLDTSLLSSLQLKFQAMHYFQSDSNHLSCHFFHFQLTKLYPITFPGLLTLYFLPYCCLGGLV